MKNRYFWFLLLLGGCAGWSRDCSSCMASSTGSDWLVAQYGYDGKPINCYKLPGTAITNEPSSDGIFWESPNGNLIHISGWYERVQVANNQWEKAAKTLRVDLSECRES